MVQQLVTNTTGGVVTEAQALMVIVPEDANVTAEVTLENKDIGFVKRRPDCDDQAGDLHVHPLRNHRREGDPRDGRCGER
jgi:hypothetical protein